MTISGWPILQIIIGLFFLSLLVFIHEFGHFIVARMVGVRVITFSIGFGKKLFGKIKGDTEYRFSALPFGGYVKLAGQEPDDEEDYGSGDYRNKKIWQRSLIVIAGPLFNYLFAFFALWMLFMIGIHERPNISDVRIGGFADSSAALHAGMKIGDKIVKLDNININNWEQFYTTVMTMANREVKIRFIRNGKEIEKEIVPKKVNVEGIGSYGDVGIYTMERAVVGKVYDSSAASKAKIQTGDTIIAINEKTIYSWGQMVAIVRGMNKSGIFTIKRGNNIIKTTVTPHFNKKVNRYVIGISMAMPELVLKRYGPIRSISKAFEKTNRIIQSMRTVFKGLFHKSVSVRSMAGPIGIIQMTGNAAKAGMDVLISFLAMISLNLAIINLLPLGITDGGVLLFLMFEKLRGKPLSLKAQTRIQQIAIVFFLSLFLFVTLNDVTRFVKMLSY